MQKSFVNVENIEKWNKLCSGMLIYLIKQCYSFGLQQNKDFPTECI